MGDLYKLNAQENVRGYSPNPNAGVPHNASAYDNAPQQQPSTKLKGGAQDGGKKKCQQAKPDKQKKTGGTVNWGPWINGIQQKVQNDFNKHAGEFQPGYANATGIVTKNGNSYTFTATPESSRINGPGGQAIYEGINRDLTQMINSGKFPFPQNSFDKSKSFGVQIDNGGYGQMDAKAPPEVHKPKA